MPTDTILLEYDGPIAIISNNRPDKHNAANDEMDDGLWEILSELEANEEVRAVLEEPIEEFEYLHELFEKQLAKLLRAEKRAKKKK